MSDATERTCITICIHKWGVPEKTRKDQDQDLTVKDQDKDKDLSRTVNLIAIYSLCLAPVYSSSDSLQIHFKKSMM